MELTHDFVVPASIDAAWATFMDLEGVGSCFPGATVTESTGDTFAGTVKVKLGPIALVYAGTGQFIERDDAAHRAVIEAKGKDKRGNGTAGATVVIQLAPADGGSRTRVDVTTELAITGKPAQFGRGVMQDVSDKLLAQFVACIESKFAAESVGAQSTSDASVGAGGGADGAEKSHGEPLPQYRAEVADDEGMALSPAEIAEGLGSDDSSAGSSAAPGAAPAPAAGSAALAAPARPATPRPAVAADDSIDLGATVLPVLIKSYAPYLLAGALGLAIGLALGRRNT